MLDKFLSLFLQSNCPLCQRSTGEIVCFNCQNQLKSCQLNNPRQFWQGKLPLFVWGIYQGKLKQAIAALKYDKHLQLAELMGDWLAEAWLNSSLDKQTKKLTVIPIPLHQKKLQDRGFNQAELIARSFCRLTGYSLQAQGLERVKETQAMFNLNSLDERKSNVRDAFVLGKGLQKCRPNSPVLLIDDIYTTGTTASEAAKLLRDRNILVVGVGAIATPNKLTLS
jgi:ComF family protein